MAGGSLADESCLEELAALVEHGYSTTWSARCSSDCGIVRPSAFAVLMLIARGAPLLHVQAVGGWRSAAVLLKVYARWMDTGLGIPGRPAATPAQPRQVAWRLTS